MVTQALSPSLDGNGRRLPAKRLLPAALCALLLLTLALVYVRAQTNVAPAPVIDSITQGDGWLAAAWTASTSTTVTAYDLRYIETSADETIDANWTLEEDVWTTGSGNLEHAVIGLTNSVQYDVQVRAVDAQSDGEWSATVTGTPTDYGNSRGAARQIDLNTSVVGSIHSTTDDDYFQITVSEASGVFIYTTSYITGFLPTEGELQNSSGTRIKEDDNDSSFRQHGPQLFLWHTLAAGAYYVKVEASATGFYTLHTQTMKDTTGTADATDLELNGFASGILDPAADDEDYFKIELSQTADLMVRVTRANDGLDTEGTLLDSNGDEIAVHDDSFLSDSLRRHFILRERLDAGVYYLKVANSPGGQYRICEGYTPQFFRGTWNECPDSVSKDAGSESGPYTVSAEVVSPPGSSRSSARTLDLGEHVLAGGRIDTPGNADYFRITVGEPTHVRVQVVSASLETDGVLLNSGGRQVDAHLSEQDYVPGGLGFILRGSADTGTSYIKVTAGNSTATGAYTIVAEEDIAYASFIDDCSAISTDYDDPLYGCQWHLDNTGRNGATAGEDINVQEVWENGNLGAGVNVAIVDNGLYYDHQDLRDNVDKSRNQDYTLSALERLRGRGDVFERYFTHGTKVAGVIAARDNDLGVRGVAPRATVYAYNWVRNATLVNLVDAMTRNMDDTWVSNNSWGFPSGPGLDRVPRAWELAVEIGVTRGFAGKGIFYLFSAGNGGTSGDNSNLSEFANYYAVTAVCAVDDRGQRYALSEEGANLWVCAPSRGGQPIVTTDNYDRYEESFGGTSASTAIVSGVAALVRNANPDLTWRDVKLILAASARKNDASNSGWEEGAYKYGTTTVRYNFNHEYGFGVVDAKAAVDLAENWTNIPPLRKETAGTAEDLDLSIPDNGTSVSSTATVGSGVSFIEFVEINASFNHPSFRDLRVELVSPSGAVSTLSVPYDSTQKYPVASSFRFGSARHLGESAAGTWRLRVADTATGDRGTLESWSIVVYGHREALPLGAPAVASVTPDSEKLTIAWTAPTDTGTSAIRAYDLRYIETSADETVDSNWTVRDNAWTSGDLEYTIPNLTDGTAYDIQVRAVNDDGDGPWSGTAVGTPVASSNTAPGIHSLRADDGALSVAWTAPTDTGGATTTVYDVRYIETSADESVDANWTVRDDAWTSGDLRYAVTGLENGVSYDVQVRAVNDGTDGPWSGAATGAPSDHGHTLASATTILPDTRVWGSITVGDEDFFELELSKETGVWIFTTGDIDTVGDLLDDSGLPIDSNDTGRVLPNPDNFFLWRTLAPGTYYIKVSGYESAQGTYALNARTFTDTTGRSNAAELKLGGSASGMLDPEFDEDYFKLVLSEDADVIIRSSGFPDTTGSLLDSGGGPIEFNDDGYLPTGIRHFLIRESLAKGTYYLRVAGFAGDTGPYTIYATSATAPGSTVADAQPLALGVAAGGSIDAADDVDYFSITVTEPTYVAVRTVSDTIYLDGALLDSNSSPLQPDFVQGAYRTITFTIRDRLDPGTYYVKVTGATSTDIGLYNIMAIEEAGYTRFLDRCSGISTTFADTLYGCQWHLSNNGQFPGGARQDINVEEVWAAGTLGAGITVAVVDDGMHHGHEDLKDNVTASLNHDYTGRNDIYGTYDDHGTAVAGIIAARDNSLGMRGVAPRATIYGYNLLLNHTDMNEANAMFLNATTTAVSNNSWGTPDIFTIGFANSFWEAAVENGVKTGFYGKGIFYVWAAGNGGDDGGYSNLDEYTNHYAVTAVCAVNHADVRSNYSEPGSNLWVCAPSNSRGMPRIATTDNGNRYRGNFGGTSAATPIVSGVAALMRSANDSLTWRDLKLILADSARKNDEHDSGWETGALKYRSATERYHFNHEYGFGVVDAKAAVDLARSWTNAPPLREISATSADVDLAIPDATSNGAGTTVTSSVTIDPYVEFAEFVEVNAHFDHDSFRDLDVDLVSPSGAVSKLVPPSARRKGAPLTSSFRFGSAKHLGEDAAGVWTLRITDRVQRDRGTLRSWGLTVYGHGSLPGPPEIATVTPGGGTLTLDWTVPSDIGDSAVTQYNLRYIRADAPDKSARLWTTEQDVGSPGNPHHVLTGLDGDVEYDIQVRAVNSDGSGPWSKETSEKPETSTPSAPSITSITPGDRALAVVWTAPTDIGGEAPTSYDVRHIETSADETVDSNWTVIDRAWTGGALRRTITGLTNGAQYDIQVRAVNSGGDGAWSTTSTGTPTQDHVPVTLSDGSRRR